MSQGLIQGLADKYIVANPPRRNFLKFAGVEGRANLGPVVRALDGVADGRRGLLNFWDAQSGAEGATFGDDVGSLDPAGEFVASGALYFDFSDDGRLGTLAECRKAK